MPAEFKASRARLLLTPAACSRMLTPRCTSFSFFRWTLTIRFPYTYPRRVMAPLESMFRIIFWAVPAFIRVEPEITSGPTSATIARSAAFSRGELRLQVTAIVLVPRRRAYSSAATVNGVRPLAAIPTTTSCFWSFRLVISRSPNLRESSLASTAVARALGPPAITN